MEMMVVLELEVEEERRLASIIYVPLCITTTFAPHR